MNSPPEEHMNMLLNNQIINKFLKKLGEEFNETSKYNRNKKSS